MSVNKGQLAPEHGRPRDHMNIGILDPAFKAQSKEDSRNYGLQDPHVHLVF